MNQSLNHQQVCPGDKPSFIYWAFVMDISPEQLNAAILETGSLDADVLSQHVSKDKSFFYLKMFIKASWFSFRSRFYKENSIYYS
ncbi:MAG: hypothetical protein M3R27_07475 [Bacteroidota bacterium]|nr:hypothetical protein [Bacteroidota bacterium]